MFSPIYDIRNLMNLIWLWSLVPYHSPAWCPDVNSFSPITNRCKLGLLLFLWNILCFKELFACFRNCDCLLVWVGFFPLSNYRNLSHNLSILPSIPSLPSYIKRKYIWQNHPAMTGWFIIDSYQGFYNEEMIHIAWKLKVQGNCNWS